MEICITYLRKGRREAGREAGEATYEKPRRNARLSLIRGNVPPRERQKDVFFHTSSIFRHFSVRQEGNLRF